MGKYYLDSLAFLWYNKKGNKQKIKHTTMEDVIMANNEYLVELLKLAQSGDMVATNSLISNIRDNEMRKRIGKYLHKNRQCEDEDLKQEFLIGVALSISKADLEIGDPIEYIISQGVYRVRSYLRKHIMQNTTQICRDCGYESRLNRVGNHYKCKKCGSSNVETRETHDHDDIAIMNQCAEDDEIERLIEDTGTYDIIERFRSTLDPNTKVYSLFVLLYDEDINSSNPDVVNYIADIAKKWNTSQTLVVQVREKLKCRLMKFCDSNGLEIKHNRFIQIK